MGGGKNRLRSTTWLSGKTFQSICGHQGKGTQSHAPPCSLYVPFVHQRPFGQVETTHFYFCVMLCDPERKGVT